MNPNDIKIIINVIVFILAILLSCVLIWKIKLGNKSYKLLFVAYTLFWVPLMLLRENTGTFEQKSLQDLTYLWIPLAAYGFIGIFARPIADLFAYKTNSHKSFIYVALISQLVTYIPILIWPCLTTNVIQSIGVGIGASCIGTYQLLFNEQYGKSHQFLTVSILSIPPLLADFISSPITSLIRSYAESISKEYDADILKWVWMIGIGFVLITFVLIYFIKENKSLVYKDNESKQQIKTKNEWIYFWMLGLLGSLIAFIKFSNSSSIAVLHIQKLAELFDCSKTGSYEGYLSVLFSIGQLTGGLITGLILVRKFNKITIFTIGSIVWIIYEVLCLLIYNPYAYLGIHILNGLGYGILYNLILGFILMRCFKTNKITPMGIYQAILSIGITFSTWLVPWIKSIMNVETADKEQYKYIMTIINSIVIGAIVLSIIVFMYCCYLEKKIKIDDSTLTTDKKIVNLAK